jgi:hypothetical protein
MVSPPDHHPDSLVSSRSIPRCRKLGSTAAQALACSDEVCPARVTVECPHGFSTDFLRGGKYGLSAQFAGCSHRVGVKDVTYLHGMWALGRLKFFCANARCARHIFTERLPGLVAPWTRRTQRLAAWLAPMGVAIGGAAGARLSQCLGVAFEWD